MAIFGRGQPHQPVILSLVGPGPSKNKIVQQGAAIGAALFARRPRGAVVIKRLGPPPSVAHFVGPQRDRASEDAELAARRPRGSITIKTIGPPKALGQFRGPQRDRASEDAVLAYRTRPARIVIKPKGPTPSVAQLVKSGEKVSQAQVVAARTRPARLIIKVKGPTPSVALFVGPQRDRASTDAELAARRPRGVIIRKVLGPPPPIAQFVSMKVYRSSQDAMLAYRTRPARIVIKTSIPVVPFAGKGSQFTAIANALFAHRPLFKPLILGAIAPPSLNKIIRPFAAVVRRDNRPNPIQVIIKTGLGQPIPKLTVQISGAFASREAANIRRRPLFQPIIKVSANQAIVGTFRFFSALAAATRFRTQHFATGGLTLNLFPPLGGPPTAARPLVLSYASIAAAYYFRRIARVIINKLGLGKPWFNVYVRPFCEKNAQAEANRRARQHWLVLAAGNSTQPQPPPLPRKADRPFLTGFFASMAASIFYRRRYFPPQIIPVPTPPGIGLIGHAKPFVPRVPLGRGPLTVDDAVRIRYHTDLVSIIFNALFGHSQLRQLSAADFKLLGIGGHKYNGKPGIDNDSKNGYEVGSVWVDTSVTPRNVYICIDNTRNAAIWKLLS